MVSHPVLIVMLVAAALSMALAFWDAWHGEIRTEDGPMPTTIRDKAPSLYAKMLAGRVIGAVVMFVIVTALVIWLW